MSKLPYNAFNDLPHDDEVVSRARAIFGRACEGADSHHTLRLGLARRKALDTGANRSAARLWAPLAGVAAACCALAIGLLWMRPETRIAPPTQATAPAPIRAGQVDNDDRIPEVGSSQMEMVQDLDFYRWLASQPAVARTTRKDGA